MAKAKFSREKVETRGKMLTMRISATEHEALRAMAGERGLKLAGLLRAALDEYVRKHARRSKS